MNALPETKKVVQRRLQALGLYDGAIDGIDGPKTWDAIERLACGSGVAIMEPAAATTAAPAPLADPRSEGNIGTLLAPVQPIARAFLAKLNARFGEMQNGVTAKIIGGTRTYAEQDNLYAQGRTKPGAIVTNARGGYSNHNFGIAFDIGLFAGSAYLEESPLYATAGAIGKSLGLEWGGDWASIQDKPHFEWRPAWATDLAETELLVELRHRKATGETIA
jgi:peptidoglycan L-alanyl-D-glutamate endopeptidase CwlK